MDAAWEEAMEGCLGYLATEKSHAVNTQLINRIALESVRGMDGEEPWRHRTGPGRQGTHSVVPCAPNERKRNWRPSSMKMIVVALRHFFAHLKREGLIEHDLLPALDLPKAAPAFAGYVERS